MNFNYLSYSIPYSVTGDSERSMRTAVCFSGIYYNHLLTEKTREKFRDELHRGRDFILDHTYTLEIEKFYKDKETNHDNNCVLPKTYVRSFLRELRKFLPFSYHITEYEEHFHLIVHFKGYLMEHKVLLALLRNLFEFPYCVLLYDAYKLRKYEMFKDLNIINLLILVINTYGYLAGGDNHCFIHHPHINSVPCSLLTDEKLKSILKRLKNSRSETHIQDIFYNIKGVKREELNTDINRRSCYQSQYWLSKKDFEDRLKAYINNYNILKPNE